MEMDITLHNAKITTLGENVEDVFFITDSDDNPIPIEDGHIGQLLQDEIKKHLDAEISSLIHRNLLTYFRKRRAASMTTLYGIRNCDTIKKARRLAGR